MEPLKEMFNKAYFEQLAEQLNKVHKINKSDFVADCCKNLEPLSLNERMRQGVATLKKYLPSDNDKSIDLLKKVIPHTKGGYTNLIFPEFVGLYGLDDFETSLDALKFFTGFGSSEFAIRHFLKKDFSRTLPVLIQWSRDKDHHVRRLSSEGSRARLPWSFKLDRVLENPELTRPILENLKTDDYLYVRKSVANHLNDFNKEHPDYLIKVLKSWDQQHPGTAWIIRHASRNLIKNGNAASLAIFEYEKQPKVKIKNFKLVGKEIKLGSNLEFAFEIVSEKAKEQKLVIDYIIHYKKQSGALSKKVFKLKELNLSPNATCRVTKKQVIKDFTTRKHFAGKHLLEIQVNGKVLDQKPFTLIIQ